MKLNTSLLHRGPTMSDALKFCFFMHFLCKLKERDCIICLYMKSVVLLF